MQTQEQLKHECVDGQCPPDIDLVKEIGLSPLEKRAIFVSLQREIAKSRELARQAEEIESKVEA